MCFAEAYHFLKAEGRKTTTRNADIDPHNSPEDAAKDASNEKDSPIKCDKDNRSQSSDDSKNWSTEGNVRGDITKDNTTTNQVPQEDNKDCKINDDVKPRKNGKIRQ